MNYRLAVEADLAGEYEVFRAAIEELYGRHSFAPPPPVPEAFLGQQGHVLRSDPERCFVAEDGGRVVAFASAWERAGFWYLSALFVRPEFQSKGVGRELLERVWGDGYARRLTMTDAIQPASNGLYASRGLIPATPVFGLGGAPGRVTAPAGLEAAEPEPGELAALDRVAYGFDRAVDHRFWQRHAVATLWRREGGAVAYSYAWPQGRIGPVAGVDGEAAATALQAELARRRQPAGIPVPGSARELFAAALGAGLRITGPPGLLLLSDGEPPQALALSGYALL